MRPCLDRHDALQLFEYDHWANGRIVERLTALAPALPQAEKLLAHVVGAEEVWYEIGYQARLRHRGVEVESGTVSALPSAPSGVLP